MRGLVKWIGGPALAIVLGYYWVGPHFAGDAKLNKLVQEGKAVAQSRLSGTPISTEEAPPEPKPDESQPQAKPSDAPAPRVTVGVKPIDAPGEDAPQPRRRRRHHRAAASDEAPAESTPERNRTGPDSASTP